MLSSAENARKKKTNVFFFRWVNAYLKEAMNKLIACEDMRKTITRTSSVESKVQPNIGTIHSKSAKKNDAVNARVSIRHLPNQQAGLHKRSTTTWDAFVSELEFE